MGKEEEKEGKSKTQKQNEASSLDKVQYEKSEGHYF